MSARSCHGLAGVSTIATVSTAAGSGVTACASSTGAPASCRFSPSHSPTTRRRASPICWAAIASRSASVAARVPVALYSFVGDLDHSTNTASPSRRTTSPTSLAFAFTTNSRAAIAPGRTPSPMGEGWGKGWGSSVTVSTAYAGRTSSTGRLSVVSTTARGVLIRSTSAGVWATASMALRGVVISCPLSNRTRTRLASTTLIGVASSSMPVIRTVAPSRLASLTSTRANRSGNW